ncbi:Crp/Fnr family transcriptional regulator [Caulobacter sp.]|uniref:Crp/Fnr family transcriptional regulator n=1 Tax=Caulobacter sp. TaxID=78 RepID=UPI0025C0495A|nr:Crp/Fnr family transcriptional regulator [Caulobacter sp.]
MDPFIRKLERRDDLSEVEREALRALPARLREVRAGRNVVGYAARVQVSCLLISGICGRFSALASGARQYTEISVPGDFVDLHGFVMKHLDHGVHAFSNSTVLDVPHEALKTVTERYPHLTRMLWLETVIDAAVHRQWLLALGRQNGPARLAHLICELYLRLEVVGLASDMRMDLPLTQQELGEVLGFSVVHANRTLQALRRRDLITWRDQKVEILDWARLAQLAEFDPTYLRLQKEPI